MVFKRVAILLIMAGFLTGCASMPKTTADVAELQKIKAPEFSDYTPPEASEGSLWTQATGISLYREMKARKIGDIVVVRIVEDPEAQLDANTSTSRSSTMNAKLKFLGYMKALALTNPNLAQDPGNDDLISSTLGSNFDGTGTSDRKGYIKAYISAVIVKVFPNGNFYINGKREINVNNETQYIALSGIVRPEDISSSNEISSTYVADAKIYYSGVGAVSDKQKPGWLGGIIDHAWPF